jgi:drug/metabolite transporter (DMT)-like permease
MIVHEQCEFISKVVIVNSKPALNWRLIAPLCGLLAAVGYTATNICLRSVTDLEPAFVACVRTFPTLVLMAPLLLLRIFRGQSLVASNGHVLWLLVTGIFTQIFGNVLFQWSLGIIGLALSVPLLFGSMIIGSAAIGKLFLKEHVSRATLISILFLMVAVTVLTLGAQAEVGALNLSEQKVGLVTLAVLGNMISGFAYSTLGAVMRRGMKAGMSIEMTLILLSVIGFISLASWSVWQYGPSYISAVSFADYQKMLFAGVLNALAFYALANALQHLNVVYVHLINASQAAMAAIAGVMIFSEPLTWYLVVGILLTATGLLLPSVSQASRRMHSKSEESSPGSESTVVDHS